METPIERDIRVTREREEKWRWERDIPQLNGQDTLVELKASKVRNIASVTAVRMGSRSKQPHFNQTSFERELQEAAERERELKAAGRIKTTSEDTLDSEALLVRTAPSVNMTEPDPGSVLAPSVFTSIQQEIEEARKREKELKEAGRIKTMSEDTFDIEAQSSGEGVATSGTFLEESLKKLVHTKHFISMMDLEMTMPHPITPAKPQDSHNATNFPLHHSVSVGTGLNFMESHEDMIPVISPKGRDGLCAKNHYAASFIQQEMQAEAQREKELREAGKILTMSEETVDAKVIRLGNVETENDIPTYQMPNHSFSFTEEVMSLPSPTSPTKTQNAYSSPRSSISSSSSVDILQKVVSTGTLLRITTAPLTVRWREPLSVQNIHASTSKLQEKQNKTKEEKECLDVQNTLIIPDGTVDSEVERVVGMQKQRRMSVKEKMQKEQREMKMREDELRIQRSLARSFSQPTGDSQQIKGEEKLSSLPSSNSNPGVLNVEQPINCILSVKGHFPKDGDI